MINKEMEKELKKLREDFEIEKANLRSNYFLSILVIIAYILIEKAGETELLGVILSKMEMFLGITTMLVLFYIKDLIKYSQYIVKKYIFKIRQ